MIPIVLAALGVLTFSALPDAGPGPSGTASRPTLAREDTMHTSVPEVLRVAGSSAS